VSTNDTPEARGTTYRWYVVAVLAAAQIVSFLDRTILSLLITPIKHDLHLSDTELGLLTGLGFALLYCLLGVPVGRLADVANRRNLICAGVLFWSVMTALCGLARSFWTLFAARIGVGLGETTLIPGAASMLGDYFPAGSLGRAMSTFGMGAYLGSGLALIGGGALLRFLGDMQSIPWLGGAAPWQAAFFAAAAPGLLIVLLLLTVREPKRRVRSGNEAARTTAADAFRHLWQYRGAYGRHFIVSCTVSLFANASSAWLPTFLVRKHGVSVAEAGMTFGLVVLLAGTSAIYAGGYIVDRLWARGVQHSYALLFTLCCSGALLPGVLFPHAEGLPQAMVLLVIYYSLAIMPISVTIAALQLMTPPPMRGLITAVFLSGSTLVGLGLGPTAVALLSEHAYGGPMGLPASLSTLIGIVAPLGALAAWTNRHAFARAAAAAGVRPPPQNTAADSLPLGEF
jgi:MFS family permease